MWSLINKHTNSILKEHIEVFLRFLQKKKLLITYRNHRKFKSDRNILLTHTDLKDLQNLKFHNLEFQLISDQKYFHEEVYKTLVQILATLKEYSEISTVFKESQAGYTANISKTYLISQSKICR